MTPLFVKNPGEYAISAVAVPDCNDKKEGPIQIVVASAYSTEDTEEDATYSEMHYIMLSIIGSGSALLVLYMISSISG